VSSPLENTPKFSVPNRIEKKGGNVFHAPGMFVWSMKDRMANRQGTKRGKKGNARAKELFCFFPRKGEGEGCAVSWGFGDGGPLWHWLGGRGEGILCQDRLKVRIRRDGFWIHQKRAIRNEKGGAAQQHGARVNCGRIWGGKGGSRH